MDNVVEGWEVVVVDECIMSLEGQTSQAKAPIHIWFVWSRRRFDFELAWLESTPFCWCEQLGFKL